MKKLFLVILVLITCFNVSAQTKPTEKVIPVKLKDTVKTEVVEVITTYNPEIADATKISIKPSIELLKESEKKELSYTIFSVPVASTFIPKSGAVKGVDVGVKERIYDNFIAVGFGNYTSPYFETFLHRITRFESEFGLSAKYNASFDNIENTLLNSNFSNLEASIFFKKEERYFDWKIKLNSERNEYNWYGIKPIFIAANTLNGIEEDQTYNYFNIVGEIDFLDAYIDKSLFSVSYFSDALNSKEYLMRLDTDLDIPISFLKENLQIDTKLEYLNGEFTNNYTNTNLLNYSFFTAKIHPVYKTNFGGFSLNLGAKFVAAIDTENSLNHFLIYPDLKIQKAIIKDNLDVFTGVFGDLKTNTYKNFTEENPFVSPTLFITQTSQKFNTFFGFKGIINNNLSFNIYASLKNEEDKALFVKNNTKSDGMSNTFNGVLLKGYEYGNSFNVVYDDVKTTSIFAELSYDFNKNITFETNVQFDSFNTTNEQEAWNLPPIQANFIAKYKNSKWYATSTILFVGDRKDLLYINNFPTPSLNSRALASFADINLNGGYHFNDKFSVFVKFNNILNKNYQRFAFFEVQGFQVLGGITYKFDF